jgi:exodeoxyribonuclease V gamma subunit
MLELTYSNDGAELLDALVRRLVEQRTRGSIFDTIQVLVPNRTVETYVKLGIAERTGIAANIECSSLGGFLADALERSKAKAQLIQRAELEGWLLELFFDQELLTAPELAPVARYLGPEGLAPEAIDLRRHQLSTELAALFDEYDHTRPEMLEAWPARRFFDGTSQGETEAWQRRLWVELFGKEGRLARRTRSDGVAQVRLGELWKRVNASQLALPRELHLFGFSYLSAVFQRCYAELGKVIGVAIYALNPSREFWEDVGLHPSMRQLDLFPRSKDSGVDPDDEDPLYLAEAADTPALRLWGRPGRESIRLANAIADFDFNAAFTDPLERGATLLRQLQRDILVREPERRKIPDHFDFHADDSLRILACPSIRRELEAIAAEIWSLLEADEEERKRRPESAGPPLRFNDIAVFVNARQAEAYQAQLSAVFREAHDIPHNIVDLPLVQESRLVEAIELLFALPLGQYRRPELLRLVTHPAVSAGFPDLDPDDWLRWCDALGIVHGADHEDHRTTYIERDLFNWDQGLRRLALGAFMTGRRSGDQAPYPLGEERYLPEEIAESKLADAGRLGLLVRSLIADARFARSAQLSLTDWAGFLSRWITTYLVPSSPADERVLRRCLRAVHDLGRADAAGAKVGYRIASERVRAAIAGLRGSRGQHLADGVVVQSFLPMRAVPFRVIFVAGLGEGRFPAAERASHLDLRSGRRRPGDISPRERDKYLFLETLLSARDRLILSHVARDELTGEALQPSSVILELLEILEKGYLPRSAIESRILVRHRLRRYDPEYFPELFRYAAATGPDAASNPTPASGARRCPTVAAEGEARALALGLSLRDRLGIDAARIDRERVSALVDPEALPRLIRRVELEPAELEQIHLAAHSPPDRIEISVAALRKFLECPLQGWARLMLGMRDDEDEDDVLAQEDEVFSSSALESTMLLREVFLASLPVGAGEVGSLLEARAEALELRGLLPTAVFKRAERQRHVAVLGSWWEGLRALARPPPRNEPFRARVVRFGRADEHADVDELLDPIVLDLEIGSAGSRRSLRAEVRGQTSPLLAHEPASLILVRGGFGPNGQLRQQREALKAFLDMVMLAAAGRATSPSHAAYLLSGDRAEKTSIVFSTFSREQARSYLALLVGELMGGEHAYSLPIEAVFTMLDRGARSVTRVIEEQRQRALRQTGPSDRGTFCPGPVPHAELFAPPTEEEARLMIARRFGPYVEQRKKGGRPPW